MSKKEDSRLHRNHKQEKNRKINIIVLSIFAILILFIIGVSSSDSSSNDSSTSTASSKKSGDSDSQKKKSEKAVNEINNEFGQHEELNGMKVKLDSADQSGILFDVTVPDNAINAPEGQQREIYKNVYKIIVGKSGSESPSVYFYDQAGNKVAHSTFTGNIKLEETE